MDAQRKRDTAIAVFIVCVVLLAIYRLSGMAETGSEFPITGAPITGVVVSVSGTGEEREAVVKLERGGETKAAVPAQCVVFPGYVVTLGQLGRGLGAPKFRVLFAKEGNDT